jgi:hypothetical protein
MIASEDWLFIHIPKTSGTNFQRRLLEENLAKDFHKAYNRHFTHQPLSWWEKRLLIKDRQILAIVRNPYSRFLSLYNHISSSVNNLPEYKHITIQDFEGFIRSNQFEKINNIIKAEVGEWLSELSFDIFWPQFKFIESDRREVNVFKYETDLPKLEKLVDCNFTSTNYNQREYDRNLINSYSQYTKSAVYSLYEEDFKRWQYSDELF